MKKKKKKRNGNGNKENLPKEAAANTGNEGNSKPSNGEKANGNTGNENKNGKGNGNRNGNRNRNSGNRENNRERENRENNRNRPRPNRVNNDKQPNNDKPQQQAKPAAKPESKKPAPKKAEKKKTPQVSALKNLMDSVSALEKSLSAADSEATIQKGTETANTGIEGGSGGSYFSELSISETDAIAARLRQCWNLDPGAMGIEDMIVEIRAYLNRDGTVQKVDILDSSRYNRDVYFRSVADSARRAVYICQPYGVLPQKYGDKYDVWKTMLLRFDPINHTVR